MILPTEAEAKAMRYPQRVIGAIKIDRDLQMLHRLHQEFGHRTQTYFKFLEMAALSRYYLTHNKNNCVGRIVGKKGHYRLELRQLIEPTVTIKPTVSTIPIVPTVNAVVSVGTMVTMSIEQGKQAEARAYVTSEMGVCE